MTDHELLLMAGVGRVEYLLRDEFSIDRAAGAVNGTPADPGPGGPWTVTDIGNRVSKSAGRLRIASGGSVTDGGMVAAALALTRIPGRMVLGRTILEAVFNTNEYYGFNTGTGYSLNTGNANFYLEGTGLFYRHLGQKLAVLSVTRGRTFDFAAILRATGSVLLIRDRDGDRLWRLAWVDALANTTPLYVQVGALVGSTDAVAEFVRVPSALWLPAPLASDSFNRADAAIGSTDGQGHAEGAAGGLGSGGGGLAWTGSTWAVFSNRARNVPVVAADNFCTLDLATSNVLAIVKINAVTTGAGLVLCLDSTSNPQNYLVAYHDGTNVVLTKVVGGVSTGLITVAATFVSDARLLAIKDGTAVRVYYNDVFIGTQQTVSDAGIVNNTRHGMYSLHTNSRLDDAVVYARGNEGQYSALNRWSQ